MAYDPGAIDATLAAAVGDDPALIAELRFAFLEGVAKALTAIAAAKDDADAWAQATARLRGLAASFGAVRLMALATSAAAAEPGDTATIARLERAAKRL